MPPRFASRTVIFLRWITINACLARRQDRQACHGKRPSDRQQHEWHKGEIAWIAAWLASKCPGREISLRPSSFELSLRRRDWMGSNFIGTICFYRVSWWYASYTVYRLPVNSCRSQLYRLQKIGFWVLLKRCFESQLFSSLFILLPQNKNSQRNLNGNHL